MEGLECTWQKRDTASSYNFKFELLHAELGVIDNNGSIKLPGLRSGILGADTSNAKI